MSNGERPADQPPEVRDGVEESVLAVPRDALVRAGVLPRGFTTEGVPRFLAAVAAHGAFHPRSTLENDPSRKQVIPYAVVVFRKTVFLLRRTSRGGEARLHRKLSIGVGGHVNPEGAPPDRLVEAGFLRELHEELVIDSPFGYRPVGLINDDETPVGQVHVGLVYRVEMERPEVRVRETDVLEGSFVPVEDLAPRLGEMESWSRLVAEKLFSSSIHGVER